MKESSTPFEKSARELNTLYKCSQVLQSDEKPIHAILEEVVLLIPEACRIPSARAARIQLAGMEFVTPNCPTAKHGHRANFATKHGLSGAIEVVCLDNRPGRSEPAVQAEEMGLIDMIANMIKAYISRKYDEEALRQTEANQRATINNTNFLIWSVNREYELISFNKPFSESIKKSYGIEPKLGMRVTDDVGSLAELRSTWIARYNQALAGETFKVKQNINGNVKEYSLNPIIEGGKTIGVSVFGEDISERVKLEHEMIAVNKRLAETRLMALRAVMNPHFIFNCLNSIQYYIMENDQRSAVTYLSKFSKLIRTTLDNSVLSKGRLSAAIDLIKLYAELESLRFEDKFDLIVDVDPDIDTESVEIPSLLIQPYIENAIVHGLYNKKEKGMLRIAFKSQKEKLLVEIEDNGVGRKAASEQKQLNLPNHRSLGVALTEERLKLLNGEGGATVEITDLEKDGMPLGTLVKIWIGI